MQKKEQGNTGAREVVSFHTELQALEQCQGRARGRAKAGTSAFFFSFTLSEVECFSALLSCYLENIYLLYLVMYSLFLRMSSNYASIF